MRQDAVNSSSHTDNTPRTAGLVLALALCASCVAHSPPEIKSQWTNFVEVQGQPEPVPAEWVATPEGKFAHSIRTPNALPKDSGYRRGMTSEEYFDHLCKTEAGEHVFKVVQNVEGLYLMRPTKRPSDDDLKDLYRLEAPEIERTFQLWDPRPDERAQTFVAPPARLYGFIEEPSSSDGTGNFYVRSFGYRKGVSPMKSELVRELRSRYGLIWRGLRRPHDRELAIAGSEWIVLDLNTKEILAIQRNYARTGFTSNVPGGVWWLNALSCPNVIPMDNLPSRFYTFAIKPLRPISGKQR